MSAYLQQELDFIIRTQKIIEQYNNISLKKEEKFEVTLLLNCFVGLLILPQQIWFNNLPDTLINESDWGISPKDISYIKDDESLSVRNISRHLRNSASHYKFIAFSDNKNEINQIKFEDYNLTKRKTFEAILSIHKIEMFLNRFSNYILELMKENK